LIRGSESQFRLLLPERLRRDVARELDPDDVRRSRRVWTIGMIGIVAAGWWLDILLIALAVLVIWLFAPRWVFDYQLHRRRRLLRDQLVGCTRALANSARAGQSLAQGLTSVADEAPAPLSDELRRLMAEYELGRPLPEALLEAKDRLRLDSFSMFASTIVVSLRQGGRVTEALERISRSLQENQRIERKLESETAGGWRVVLILAGFPFLFLAGFYVVHPSGTALMFESWIGQFLTVLIVGLAVVSVWWSRRILNIEI